LAMLDVLVDRAIAGGINTIYGYFLPTKKNAMVADFYPGLGFLPSPSQSDLPEGSTVWKLYLPNYVKRNKHIKIKE
jgi:predicted enzyme involved in methoxymalonyl-ACP biosynthesis